MQQKISLDADGIPQHFKTENNPDWRGMVFGTLRPGYPQLPEYGNNCRRIAAVLEHEHPPTLDAALEIIAEGMRKNYKPLLATHAQEGCDDFGRMRTEQDSTTWPWSMIPRYAYATSLIRDENSALIQQAKQEANAAGHDIYDPYLFRKEIDGEELAHFSLKEFPHHPLKYNEVSFHIPAIGSEQWDTCHRLANRYYAEAADTARPQSERLKSAFKCYQTFSCWAPFERGSSTTAMILLSQMVKNMGLTLPPQAEGCDLNVTSIGTPFDKFYADCMQGMHFTQATSRDEITQISNRINSHNQAKEHLRTKGALWPELIHDLHCAQSTATAPNYWGHSKLCNYDTKTPERDLNIAPVILDNGKPALRVNTPLMYSIIYTASNLKMVAHPAESPSEFPVAVDMEGKWHGINAIASYEAVAPEKAKQWQTATYDQIANNLALSAQKGMQRN